jgi:protein TonB
MVATASAEASDCGRLRARFDHCASVMPTSISAASSRRGILLATVPLLAALAAGIGWYVHAASSPKPDAASASNASSDTSGEGILLGLAKSAVSEHRLVAPAGSNAYEFYLSVLQLDPKNAVARDDLNTLFPQACDVVEQTIDARDVDEAQRELALLREVDSNNYKLALLGSKLSAQRMVMTREHEAQAAAIQAREENAAR